MNSTPPIASRPNVLLITSHDSGRYYGCYGVPTVRTPAVDALAAEGVLFEQMFATAPICSPSRGSLLTGRYPLANGLVGIAGGRWRWELHDYRQHLSWLLRQAGYRTAMIGLQHETSYIDRLGFDDVSAHGVAPTTAAEALLPGWPAERRGLSAPQVADRAIAYLQQAAAAGQPFYAQVGFFESHTPYDYADCPPDDSLGVWTPPFALNRSRPTWAQALNRFATEPDFARQHLAGLQGALARVDEAVGRIVAALRKTGLEENTLLVFTTDHGVELPGAKWTLYDPGLGVAFVLRWPAGGATGGRRCPWLLSNVDFVPTLLELLRLPLPAGLNGISFAAAVRGVTTGTLGPRAAVYANWVDGLNFAVRTGRHKLIRNLYPEMDSDGRPKPLHELYDLARDPEERANLAEDPAAATPRATLSRLLDDWLAQMNDPSTAGPVTGADLPQAVGEYRRRYEQTHSRAATSQS